ARGFYPHLLRHRREDAAEGDVQTIDGVGGCDRDAAMWIEGETDEGRAGEHELRFIGRVEPHTIQAAGAGERVDDIEVAGRVEREALRTAEAAAADRKVTIRRDAIDHIMRAQRRRRHIQETVRTERQVEGGDARGQRRELAGATV